MDSISQQYHVEYYQEIASYEQPVIVTESFSLSPCITFCDNDPNKSHFTIYCKTYFLYTLKKSLASVNLKIQYSETYIGFQEKRYQDKFLYPLDLLIKLN